MRLILVGMLVLSLTGCGMLKFKTPPAPVETLTQTDAAKTLAQQQQSELLTEANTLADRLRTGELTRLEVVDGLNAKRLAIAGANAMDDEIFRLYRGLTAKVQEGTLTQSQLRAQMIKRLEQARTRYTRTKPAYIPVFTNFLMQIYGLDAL